MNILYFASLKENLKIDSENILIKENATIADIRKKLIKKYGAEKFPNNIICAVNHKIANNNTIIYENDEVAFFPPVTGG